MIEQFSSFSYSRQEERVRRPSSSYSITVRRPAVIAFKYLSKCSIDIRIPQPTPSQLFLNRPFPAPFLFLTRSTLQAADRIRFHEISNATNEILLFYVEIGLWKEGSIMFQTLDDENISVYCVIVRIQARLAIYFDYSTNNSVALDNECQFSSQYSYL